MNASRRKSGDESRALGALRAALLLLAALVFLPSEAFALKAIVVGPDQGRLEITTLGELYEGRGDSLQVETAAGEDGVVGRMSVSAATQGTNPNWIVFALTNPTDKPVERWLSADRYNVVGSGVVWPDLDARRIEAVTPSIGFVPERIKSDRADVFRITLEPGQTITYVAELSSERFARIYLWKPLDYELKTSDRQLFNGVMLGLTGLMAIFLTAIFAANHKLVFPASALVAWCVLAYLCVDFGFFHKLFQMKPEANAVYRAAAESALAASLVVFIHVFLRLALWHGLIRMLITVWLLAQFSLIAVAVVDPRLSATFARLSFVFIGGTGAGLILYLAFRGQDRALSLIPTWILFLVWIFGAGVTLSGRLSGDIVVSGLVAGLVLVLLLIGFTVTQYAFRSLEPMYAGAPSELQLKSVAVDAAGAAVWEWNARRDSVKCSPLVEGWLGLHAGELSARVDEFMRHLHQADRERFRLALSSLQERGDGKIHCDFRMRQADNSYRWFELEAAGVPGSDPRSFKCVGLMRDVTDTKRAHERLLHDAVHDSLTGLPNRELILDRLEVAMGRAKTEPQIRPAVISINIDKFKSVNTSLGLVMGDSLLLTIARRLQRHLGPNDTLARVGGDQFAILIPSEQPPPELAAHAERIRRSLRSPIKIAAQEIVLTGSLGVAVYEGTEAKVEELLKKAEVAMYRAKRGGADRIEVFGRQMKADWEERVVLESDLRKALEKNQLRILYQPIVYLPTEELAGFEAVIRWDHPQLGVINPTAFVSIAEDSDLVVKLGSYVLMSAARDAARWQKEHPRIDAPLFVSVNVASRQLFRQDLIQEIRHILGRNLVPKGSLKLEVSERLAMENPEQATEILEWLRGAGAEIALDDFGTGFSSFAYLERLPFDTIKIDQAILQAGSSNGESTLVRSIVALAHELGKKVVAKGVESGDEIAFLRSIGCEYAQGGYCGDAIPDSEVLQILKMLRRSESKLRPRGLFRTKPKRKRDGNQEQARGDIAPAAPNGNGAHAPGQAARAAADAKDQQRTVRSLPNSAVRVRARAPQQQLQQQQPQQARLPRIVSGAPAQALNMLPPPAAFSPPMPPLPPNPLVSGMAPPQSREAAPPPYLRPVEQAKPQPPSMPPPLPPVPPAPMQQQEGPRLAWPQEQTAPPRPPMPPMPPPASMPQQAAVPPPFTMPPQVAMPTPMPPANGPAPMAPPMQQPMPPQAPANGPPPPDFSGLPPAIAESLARLAGSIKSPPKTSGG